MSKRTSKRRGAPAKTQGHSPAHVDARIGHGTDEERSALARIEKRIRDNLVKGEALAWTIGHEFDALARAGLHHAAGFSTLEAYADKRFPQGYRTLKRYRRVALAFRRETVKKHGTTKLDLGLTYIALTPEDERPAEIPRLQIRVPAKGGKVALVDFAHASVSDLERAIELASSRPTAHDDARAAHAKRIRDAIQRAVAAPKGDNRHAPLVRAHVTHDGKVRVDVVAIDLDDLARVAKALAAHARNK